MWQVRLLPFTSSKEDLFARKKIVMRSQYTKGLPAIGSAFKSRPGLLGANKAALIPRVGGTGHPRAADNFEPVPAKPGLLGYAEQHARLVAAVRTARQDRDRALGFLPNVSDVTPANLCMSTMGEGYEVHGIDKRGV